MNQMSRDERIQRGLEQIVLGAPQDQPAPHGLDAPLARSDSQPSRTTRSLLLAAGCTLVVGAVVGVAIVNRASTPADISATDSTVRASVEAPPETEQQPTTTIPSIAVNPDAPLIDIRDARFFEADVDGSRLTIDYTENWPTRSQSMRLGPDDSASDEPESLAYAGLFITRNDDGAIGTFFDLGSGELMIPEGGLTGRTSVFDVSGVPAGDFVVCATEVGTGDFLCARFSLT